MYARGSVSVCTLYSMYVRYERVYVDNIFPSSKTPHTVRKRCYFLLPAPIVTTSKAGMLGWEEGGEGRGSLDFICYIP
jgi:hypothetical protein